MFNKNSKFYENLKSHSYNKYCNTVKLFFIIKSEWMSQTEQFSNHVTK